MDYNRAVLEFVEEYVSIGGVPGAIEALVKLADLAERNAHAASTATILRGLSERTSSVAS